MKIDGDNQRSALRPITCKNNHHIAEWNIKNGVIQTSVVTPAMRVCSAWVKCATCAEWTFFDGRRETKKQKKSLQTS